MVVNKGRSHPLQEAWTTSIAFFTSELNCMMACASSTDTFNTLE